MSDLPNSRKAERTAGGIGRRTLLGSAATAMLAGLLPPVATAWAQAPQGLRFGPARPYSFDALTERAKQRAAKPYEAPRRPAPDIVSRIVYEVHGKIRFRPEDALYAEGPGAYPATFFHLGNYFPTAVAMHAVDGEEAREIRYSPDNFDMPEDSIARGLPPDAGFAGFRLHESRERDDWRTQDWVAFLGASYFRAIGELGQYGLSARGIAIDTATPTPEEFPQFVEFYIAPAKDAEAPVVIDALLDGPSIAGAYRFAIQRTEGVVMDIEARLFLRRDVGRLGIAPLTSMFWYAEYGRGRTLDWRPEIHDSDGLAMWTGSGERIWRPLNNPPVTTTSTFADDNPRGFGLLQRDRDFARYLDGVRYDRRPSLWVEPLDNWGKGTVQCVEIPTDDEIHDNIGVFWTPAEPARAGQSHTLRYRLHWLGEEPYPAENVAHAVATRMGRGGEPGKPRPKGVYKFAVEFAGGPLEDFESELKPEAVVEASRGQVSHVFMTALPEIGRWQCQFDLAAEGSAPVELRVHLRVGDNAASETWLYQFHPSQA
ncbi:MAG: glucan biosynthesis protein D [Rhodospirillales bacterium]|nr:glucan biosynthesis protein D [Rhodospirillales bacterium]